ncbi:MAG: glycosyltransferase family 4 protein [Proteobacteria bacterium]|nr:glycosyltransferase family 4 protein [Pseudomonadota bacterium]
MEAVEVEPSVERKDLAELDVAIVHYWLVTWRGGEKVVQSLLKLFPKADIYTLFYDEEACRPYLGNNKVYSSCLDNVITRKHHQKMFPFYPLGIRSLRLRKKYDLIVSSESGPAKGIANPDKTPHLCYIHSPMRYCWGYTQIYLDALPKWTRGMAQWRFRKLKEWDRTTVENVDLYVANSRNIAERVKKYYGKEAEVCYPPIALDLFQNEPVESKEDYYISFGAITPYKNIGLLVETFNRLDKKLVIVGSGSEKSKLERMANDNIRFTGFLPASGFMNLIRNARAMLFPGEEDFGMAPLEVMAQGVPVIALKKGGALETVRENLANPAWSSGVFFEDDTTDSLIKALEKFEAIEEEFDPIWIKNHAREFGEDRFHQNMVGHILKLVNL